MRQINRQATPQFKYCAVKKPISFARPNRAIISGNKRLQTKANERTHEVKFMKADQQTDAGAEKGAETANAPIPKQGAGPCLIAPILLALLVSQLQLMKPAVANVGNELNTKLNENAEFRAFLESFWPSAKQAGVSRKIFKYAIGGLTPDPSIMNAQSSQPEFISPVWSYIDRAVSEERMATGAAKLKELNQTLVNIERHFGVEKQILLAIWGLESTFGKNKGDKDIIRSLATMAYKGKRKTYGRKQLIAALKILERGDIPLQSFKGSWAGAMGHTQFIPATYNHYAVDFTGDGKRDIWNSEIDALASAANYLKKAGWQTGKTWGYEVEVPKGYNYAVSGWGIKKNLGTWQRLGVRRVNGRGFPRPSDQAELLLPAGANGPAFLVLKNFRVLMRYNKSVSYVLAVGHLGDRILGYGPFVKPWPKQQRLLKYVEQKEIQVRLKQKGYNVGQIDGKIGGKTKRALRAFQKRIGLPADGHPTYAILEALRR